MPLNTKKILFLATIVLVLAFSSKSIAQSQSPKIKIAAVLGLTGHASRNADAIRKGIELAAEKLKKDGIEIDLVFEDDQTIPAKTVTAARYLLARGYKFFIGPTWSFLGSAAAPVFLRGDAVAILPAGSTDIMGGYNEVYFNLSQKRIGQLDPIVDWLKSKDINKVLILTPENDWGVAHQEVFTKAVKKAGKEAVLTDTFEYTFGLSSFKSILTRERKRGFDAILTTGTPSSCADVIKARNQLHIDTYVLATENLVDAIDLKLLSKKDLNKVYVSHEKNPSKKFQKIHQERFNESAKEYSGKAYDGLMILVLAIQATDGTPKSVRNYLRNKLDYQGVSGRIRFDKYGDVIDGQYEVVSLEP